MYKTLFWTLLFRGLSLALGLGTTVLVARLLGPEGRGLFAVATTIVGLGLQFGNLGLHSSNSYFIAKDRTLLPVLATHSLLTSFIVGGCVATGFLGVIWLRPEWSPLAGQQDQSLLVIALLWTPLAIAYLLFQNLFLGLQQFRSYNESEIYPKAIAVTLLGAMYLGRVSNVNIAFATGFIGCFLSLAWAVRRLMSSVSRAISRPSWEIFRLHFRYGFKAYLTTFFGFLILRLDVMFVQYIIGPGEAGQYSVAKNLADLIGITPIVLASILFPKLSGMTSFVEKRHLAFRSTGLTALMMLPICGVAYVLAPFLIRLLFGSQFEPAVELFRLMLPGIYFIAVETVIVQLLNSFGFPVAVVFAWLGSAIVTMGLNFWMVSTMGARGAAITSSLASFLILFLIGMITARQLAKETSLGFSATSSGAGG